MTQMNIKKLHLSAAIILCLMLVTGINRVDAKNKKVTVYLTTSDRTSELKKSQLKIKKSAEDTKSDVIKLMPETKYQTMDGFGSAITGSSSYNLMRMQAKDRKNFLTETFSESKGYGQSYVRVAIGCSDFSLSEYTCCDKEGIENFTLTEDFGEFHFW